MTTPADPQASVDLLKAMASPVRWMILTRLAEGSCVVGPLVEMTGEAQSSVSQHLHRLRASGLVSCRKRSTWREYALATGVDRLIDEVRRLERTLNPQT
ncbi:metalloregulator ArsR/SmtB family transcription factor [Brevundimonas sp.]|jgi:DNA-binding transcriptional ArsR family regulator|uniref:ArsR/SmtB family transcription factor n=1 Tax=Brevundimonas sp. TaxID=1871086 RepID=UPI0025BC2AA9|nr:metalloregulator ArsR/SmtB family transcription factor [Brevundimonas sp.]